MILRCALSGLALTAALALAACVGQRPPDAAACAALPTQPAATGAPAPHDEIDILVLSGGGSRGAYGAGFLNGWTARQTGIRRPQFDLVTGVSTGAIMAPFALLGSQYDAVLARHYDGVASSDVFGDRSWLGVFGWNSFKDATPLIDGLHRELDDATLAALTDAARQDRMVWVGATNSDSGAFATFNLSDIAAREAPAAARDDIAARIAAATAIPAFLPPQFISGCMYVDGGVRENLFVGQLGDAIKAAQTGAHATRVEIFVIINGPVEPLPRLTDNTLVAIAARGFELGVQQIQLASLREAYYFARANHYGFHWTSADGLVSEKAEAGKCGPQPAEDAFDASFTHCLFAAARAKAAGDPDPWKVALPGEPVSGAP